MSSHRLALFLAAGMITAQALPAADWRQYRGPNGNGSSGDAAINADWQAKPPALLWSLPLNDKGWNNPCVLGSTVFISDHRITTPPPDAQGKAPPPVHEDIVLALELQTGKELWSVALPGSKKDRYGYTGPTTVTDGERLFVTNRELLVTCLEAKSGKPLWQRDIGGDCAGRPPEANWGFTLSPLLDDGKLFLAPGGVQAAVVALEAATGKTLWQAPGGPAGHASPILYGEGAARQVVVYNGEGLVGYSAKDGKRLWTQPRPTQFNQNSSTPIVVGQRIFMTSAWNVGAALVDVAGDKPALVWETKELQARFSSPVAANGCIFGVSQPENPGSLVCLDAATGKVNWKQPGFEFGPLAVAGGFVLAVNGKNGEIALVEANAAKYIEHGRIKPDPKGTAWNNPVVADGKLLIRTTKRLSCYDVAP